MHRSVRCESAGTDVVMAGEMVDMISGTPEGVSVGRVQMICKSLDAAATILDCSGWLGRYSQTGRDASVLAEQIIRKLWNELGETLRRPEPGATEDHTGS